MRLGKQTPRLFSGPAQILEDRFFRRSRSFFQRRFRSVSGGPDVTDRLHPFVRGQKPDRQISRNLTPCPAFRRKNDPPGSYSEPSNSANRIPRQRVAAYCCHSRPTHGPTFDGECRFQKAGTKPLQVHCDITASGDRRGFLARAATVNLPDWPKMVPMTEGIVQPVPDGLMPISPTTSFNSRHRALINQCYGILIAQEAGLITIDAKSGDSDTGSTLTTQARALIAARDRLPLADLTQLYRATASERKACRVLVETRRSKVAFGRLREAVNFDRVQT